MNKEKRKTIREEYQKKVPAPLSSQFTGKRSKQEAVNHYNERKSKTAVLFPPGKYITNVCNAIDSSST
jgi:hypothetical protein